MAVLMSYHKLVERDSSNVDYHWKTVTLFLIILSVVSCLVVSFSVVKLNDAFDNQCILEAHVNFMEKTPVENTEENNSVAAAALSSYILNEPLADISNETYENENDIFMKTHVINDKSSEWSKASICDFPVFIPIFQACFGIVAGTMFLICGHGGKSSSQSFLPQPWRIVTPALLFFLIMFCVGISVLVKVHRGMNDFCASFEEVVPDVSCAVAMNNFMLVSIDKVVSLPGDIYKVLISFSWIMMSSWFLAFIVMVIRIIFVIDFQLVRVTVKTLEFDKDDNKAKKYKIVKIHDDDGNDAVTKC
ncbi:unnamed protein product [Diamesa tonsa]